MHVCFQGTCFVQAQWLQEDFLGYLNEWEQYVASKDLSALDKKNEAATSGNTNWNKDTRFADLCNL